VTMSEKTSRQRDRFSSPSPSPSLSLHSRDLALLEYGDDNAGHGHCGAINRMDERMLPPFSSLLIAIDRVTLSDIETAAILNGKDKSSHLTLYGD